MKIFCTDETSVGAPEVRQYGVALYGGVICDEKTFHELGRFTYVDAWSTEPGHAEVLDSFKSWISRTWFEIVGSKDLKHFKAGTRVEKLRSTKGAFYYASKSYMGKAQDCPKLAIKPGRYWGVIGRSKLKLGKREVKAVPADQAFAILRLMRRYRRANTPADRRKFIHTDPFAAKLYCNVDRWLETALRVIDPKTEVQPF